MIEKLKKKLGIHFKNTRLLENAFVHRSYLNEHKNTFEKSNETLEFLGDSVLSLITSQYLFHHFPNLKEGDYTDVKAALVRTESLAMAAEKLGLGKFILMSSGEEQQGGRTNANMLADVFESLIAVIFLDQGYETAEKFVVEHLFKHLDVAHIITNKLYISPKNRLQELTQKLHKHIPVYKTLKEEGPEHQKTFTVAVYINEQEYGTGTGKSKKQAEEQAAKKALEVLEK